MKSAEEWAESFGRPKSCLVKCSKRCEQVCKDAEDLIRAIQRDAIKAAAEKCDQVRGRYVDNFRVTKDHQWRVGITASFECAESILSLLPKD